MGVLASGRGSNLQAVLDACSAGVLKAEVAVVISNNRDAFALQRAADQHIPTRHLSSATHPDPVVLDREIAHTLQSHRSQWVLLAGYMKKVGPLTLQRFKGRIINIHPALLPEFGGPGMYGARVHRAVIEAGRRVTGVTVHVVDEEYDHGPVLAQRQVPVLEGDTPESLAERVLAEEHRLLVETLSGIAAGDITAP